MRNVMVFGCLLMALQASATELYRWQDASGQWHYGDAANVDRQAKAESVAVAPEAQNVVKTRVVKLPVKKEEKAARQRSSSKHRQAAVLSASEKKQKCDKLRDELRLQAFRYADRDYYDHECVSAVKW